MLEYYDIIIIDSGVDKNHPLIKDDKVDGVSIKFCENDDLIFSPDFHDRLGHGTAVYSIIRKYTHNASILNIKIFEDYSSKNELPLIMILEYIKNNIKCKIINVSMGVRECYDIDRFYNICSTLSKIGVVIVSAMDNEGYMSYPAIFDCVVGVDNLQLIKKNAMYEYVDGTSINIRWKKNRQRLPWSDEKYVILEGTSFACAHVTSKIYNLNNTEGFQSINDILSLLKKHADSILDFNVLRNSKYPSDIFSINKAIVFPFNKEMHALVRFHDLISFEIVDFYDISKSGRVGMSCKNIVKNMDIETKYIVKNIEKINWDSIDTLIIGHCDEINALLGEDIRYELILQAIKRKINIYSFDSLSNYEELLKRSIDSEIYWPCIEYWHVPQDQINKLFSITKPVIGIFGTSSAQGKFTLQLTLKQLFESNGYSVGCIGTEPNAMLFDMDYVFPMGYNNAINVNNHDIIKVLNNVLNSLCIQGNDVILTAGQANSIPYALGDLNCYPVRQHPFILGVQPDVILLCINEYDDYEYILNTIKYLEGTASSRVLALILYPMTYLNDWRESFNNKSMMDIDNIQIKCDNVYKNLSVPCYILGNQISFNKLYHDIISYLS